MRHLLFPLVALLCTLSTARAAEGKFTYPLGPIGGQFRVVDDQNYLRVTAITPGAPGSAAGLQVNDFIYGAYDVEFSTLGSDFQGVVRELGDAIDRAESTDGQLPLMITRPGTGTLTLTVQLPTLGPLGPAYPLTSTKFDATYEYACGQLHQRIMDDNDGDVGHPTGFVGLALLGHPNWADTTGAKPYRLSINRIRDVSVNRINNAVYAPVENLLLDGSPNPNYVGEPEGLASWALGLAVMFISEYYAKTGDADAFDEVQRGAELMANRFQWWKQPALHSNGYSPGYDQIAGMVSHGGVTGDYIHGGWGGGINMVGVHLFSGLAMAKRAGADMTVRPKDGHYFGFETAPANAVPVGMEDYDHTLTEKFEMAWDWLLKCSRDSPGTMDDGSIGYTISQGGSPYDAGGRVPGAVLGMGVYHNGVIPDTDDADRWERQKSYTARNHERHMNAHAYNLGGTMFQALAMPYLDDREQRYFLHNWKFYYNFSREPDNTLTFFHARSVNESYQNLPLCVLVNAALPRSVARGGLPHVPGFDTDRIFAHFKTPGMTWPRLEARHLETRTAATALEVEVMDITGSVMAPANYTAAWSVLSGPNMNVSFSDASSASTTATFPESGSYQIQLVATSGVLSVSEPIDIDVLLATLPTGWEAGKANYEVFTDISGGSVSDLTSATKYVSDQPDITRTITAIEGNHSGNSYGARISGYLVPAVSGDYTFHISSDDASQFWLDALDGNGLTNIASVSGWTNQYQWDKEAGQTSSVVSLTAGERYDYRVLHKEGSGGDHVAVGWTRPGTSTIEVIGSSYLAIPPLGTEVAQILTQPIDQAIALGENASFSISTEGPDPKTYQWRLNGVAHWPPSSEPTVELMNAGGGQAGTYDCVYTSGDQVLVSDGATLSFTDTGFGEIVSGGLWRETYTGINSGSVDDLKVSSKFPYFSDSSNIITSAEVPSESVANDFGQRWSGWLVPTETASYRFYVTADDSAELWLSVDALEAHKRVIASQDYAVTARSWTSVTPSDWITLQAGQRYYIELLAQENGGAEHAAIAWQKQGDADLADNAPPIPGTFLEYQMGGTYIDNGPTAPAAVDDVLGVTTGQPNSLDVVANDLDNENATLVVTSVDPTTTTEGGTVTFSGRTVTYVPAPGFTGSDSFTYTTNNSQGLTDSATVHVTAVDPSLGLQGWWRLDEESGTQAMDVSGALRHGDVSGVPAWQTAGARTDLAGSMTFDGVDDKIDIGELNHILGQTASLSFWIRTTQPGQAQGKTDSQAVVGYDAKWWQDDIKWGVLDSGGRIGLWLENDNEWAGSTTVVNDGQWRHVVLTRDLVSTEMQVFVNGHLEDSHLGTATPITYSFSTIGRIDSNDGSGAWFNGDLDDIRLYDRVLSAEEVQAVYAHTLSDMLPLAQDDTVSVSPGSTTSINVLANDVDDHQPELRITNLTAPLDGVATISADGLHIDYTAPAGVSAIVNIKYTIQDSLGQTADANLKIIIETLPNDLVAWWKLDDQPLQQVEDSSGNGYHGDQISGVLAGQTGIIGEAYSFDGGSQRVATPTITGLGTTNTLTITGWVKLGDSPSDDWSAVYSNTNGPTLNIKSDRKLRYHWSSNAHWGWDSGLVVTPNQWALVALAVDPDKAVLYLHDGTLSQATRTTAHPKVSFDAVGSLGRHTTWSSRHFKGLMDDVRLYNRTLSEAEISALYTDRLPPEVDLSISGGPDYFVPNTFSLTATVVENDRSIERVEFYHGVTKLADDLDIPYTLQVTENDIGSHAYTARAVYDTDHSVDSKPQTIDVSHGPYDHWAETIHGLSGTFAIPQADPDGDGVVNLIEYAIGGSPDSDDGAMLPRLGIAAGTQILFNMDDKRKDVSWVLKRSFNMADYDEVCRIDGATGAQQIEDGLQVSINEGIVTVTDTLVGDEERAFYQLVIEN